MNSSDNKKPIVSVYCVNHMFRLRKIDSGCCPPEELTDAFLGALIESMIHPGWDENKGEVKKHSCDSPCAMETFIVIGRPYNNNVMEAIECAFKKKTTIWIKEYERKVSEFYGHQMQMTAIMMNAWLCTNMCEVDDVWVFWEPIRTTAGWVINEETVDQNESQ